ncbi:MULTISPECIES: flagellar basal-body rod protein FlgG [Pseudoxanthomonas]|jgi:flagellar basal-body rod protein FlgG|uniref:Flagellar basal-body rod protein FlgF n=1 Tax=Pseudoxanthomonas winnipegensis TaxID=2480810 RepID=A0A4V2HDQ8_9GAMM|nr:MULTISPECIES: flagellar basal-body rod protein FlgG [Pseudoxanthomonas]PZP64129.1 MAG: flagellar basal body rod protein FlgG [Pseudoxanthomonas spadix]TAA28615.1 flagellar basal-body rod protein FlgG [Pseudoxanthomonas winnipegensis]TMN17023.1 flagellar basal-body rod protein FlgG [Pseudoxanthomonas sp. X-1]UAY74006.1 flagellar basal-body rod protein FlgG [Pseudoxanthomonas sp. X-1]
MTQALWIAKTGLDAQQTRMAVISNNLANINTTGFKRDRANFEDLLYQTQRQPGGATSEQTMLPSGMSTGTGVRVATTAKSFTQGNLSQTGNALDVAINGRGFFEVLLPDGSSAYTRDGAFQVNAENELVTNEGYPVQPGLQIPEGAQSITIGSDGTVSVQLAGQAAATQVGQLTVTDFVNPAGLQSKGGNLYTETGASGPAQTGTPGENGAGLLIQGSLEGSNVNSVEELVSMIETQRAYETNAKAISTVDSMLGFLNQNL